MSEWYSKHTKKDLADRIEELEAKGLANRVAIMRLEAKLAQAVDALRQMDVGEGWAAQIARATLAELTGGQKDEQVCAWGLCRGHSCVVSHSRSVWPHQHR